MDGRTARNREREMEQTNSITDRWTINAGKKIRGNNQNT